MTRSEPSPSEPLQRFVELEVHAIEAVDKDGDSPCLAIPGCSEPATKGHVIPKSRLAPMAERSGSRKTVWTFTTSANKLRKRAAAQSPPIECEPAGEYVSISSDYVTRRIACASHEIELFAPIDGEALDAASRKHCALISYRTLLYGLREARSAVSVFERVRSAREFGALDSEMRKVKRDRADAAARECTLAGRAQAALWRELDPESSVSAYPPFVHQSMRIADGPCVAFAAVLWRGGEAGWAARERTEAPHLTGDVRDPIPFVLTCYPDKGGHIVVASCPSSAAELLPVVIPAFDERRSAPHALLSATALETEHLMIRPSVWRAYGGERQSEMWRRHTACLPGAFSDPALAPLNLFAY